jgi:hypothetical protein
VRRRQDRQTFVLLLLTLSLPVFGAPDPAGKKSSDAKPPIELHVGIRDLVYIGQPLAELIKKFPGAKVHPFSGQDDASNVRIAEAGISCIAVGKPGELKVASIGFNLEGVYDGMAETPYRTDKGIGKGSTVNDLLEAYGEPFEVLGQQPRGALRKRPPVDSPADPKMYQYKSEDGGIKTFFLVQDHLVRRLVVNDLEPLDQHVVKGRPKK